MQKKLAEHQILLGDTVESQTVGAGF
jgi:hypothetical protein